jgi:hypothetical protein
MSIRRMDLGAIMSGEDTSTKNKRGSKHVSIDEFEDWIENTLQADRKNGDSFGKSFCNKFNVSDPALCGMKLSDEAHELIWNNYIK